MAKTDENKRKAKAPSQDVLQAPPINPYLRLASKASGALQQGANAIVPNPFKLVSGDIDTLPVGDWLMGDTTGMLDRWSKGRAPVTFPAYGPKLVNAKFDPVIVDALSFAAPLVKPALKVGVPLAKAGAKAVARNAAPMIDRMLVEKYGLPSMQPGIVKNPGGEWLAGPDNGITHALDFYTGPAFEGPPVDEAAEVQHKFRKMLKQYITNDMGAATDPVRLSIDRGISHQVTPRSSRPGFLDLQSEQLGLPKGNLGTTQQGRNWENLSDVAISASPLKEWQAYGNFTEKHPWFTGKHPDTPIFDLSDAESFDALGFGHMHDVLLDKYMAGEITPEQLRNMNMTKAMQIVHDDNQAVSDAAKGVGPKGYAANLLLPKSKEYPSGHFISELPDAGSSDEAMALVNKIGCEGGWCTQKPNAALNYGSGRNKLHTLFDKEGRPHIQYQVQENVPFASDRPESETAKLLAQYPQIASYKIEQIKPVENSWFGDRATEYAKRNPEYRNELTPLIQDFVQSGKWTNVRDLDNAGLLEMSRAGMRPALEHRSVAQELGVTPEQVHDFHLSRPEGSSPYFSKDEFHNFMKLQDTPPEFAGGGVVKSLAQLAKKHISEALNEKDFYKAFVAQHKDLRNITPADREAAAQAILKSGFNKGVNVNALPVDRGGLPQNVIDKIYGNKAGDRVYLLPKEGVTTGRNGYMTTEGYVPDMSHILDITADQEPSYAAYLRNFTASPELTKLYHGGRKFDKWEPKMIGMGEGGGRRNPIMAQGPGLYAGDTTGLAKVYLKYGGDNPAMTELNVDPTNIINYYKKMSPEHLERIKEAESRLDALGLKTSNYGLQNAWLGGREADPQKVRDVLVRSGVDGLQQYLNPSYGTEFSIFNPDIIKQVRTMDKSEFGKGGAVEYDLPKAMEGLELKYFTPPTYERRAPQQEQEVSKQDILDEILNRVRINASGSSNKYAKGLGGTLSYTQPIDENNLLRLGVSGHAYKGDGWSDKGIDSGNIDYIHKFAKGGAVEANDSNVDYDSIYEFKNYGNRETGEAKDTGALGEIRMPNGRDVMTEYSINVDGREMPSIIEGMHPADINYIRETGIVPEDTWATAVHSANKREAQGLSPFWNKQDGYAKGGKVGHPNEYVEKAQRWGRSGQHAAASMLGIGDEVDFASKIPEFYYSKEAQHNGEGDAMRHILLQGQLQQKYGELPAQALGWLHENATLGQSDAEKAMDTYNDVLGRKLGATATDNADLAWKAMQAIKAGDARTIQKLKEGYAHGGEVNYDKHYEFVQHSPISSTIDYDAMYEFT